MAADTGWDTPRERDEHAWARRERIATRIRNGSWKLLATVAAVHIVQTFVNALA